MKRSIILILSMVLIFNLAACAPKTQDENVSSTTEPTENALTPGTYKSSVYGSNGYLDVEVVISDNKIESISVPEHWETQFLGDVAIEKISEQVVEYQTLNVDSVSGATITSAAFKSAIKDCIEQADGDPSKMQEPVPSQGSKNSEVTVQEADVIIVGAGGAGLSAALTAVEEGAKVIVLEKMDVIGGNTLRCASAYNTSNPELQSALPMTDTLHDNVKKDLDADPVNDEHKKLMDDVKATYDEYLNSGSETLFDSPEWHALQTYNGGDHVGIISLIRTYTNNTLGTLNWLVDHGLPLNPDVSQGAGALWQRTHQINSPAGTGLIAPLYNNAIEKGVEIITEMKAETIIQDDSGKAIGIRATDKNGSEFHFMGEKGVIIATGGYSNNPEMRAEFNAELTPDMVSTNHPGATGDGITMAKELGAGTIGMEYVQVYPLATPGAGTLQGRARFMSGLDNVIVINKEGKRFVKEDARRDDFVAAIKEQTDSVVYDFNDSSIVKELNSFNEHVETLVELGRIIKTDTIAEMEERLDISPGVLQATVDEYNQMVADKNDPIFGRKLFADPIEVGPFYATPRAPSIHHTMGGLTINSDARVLNLDGEIIPGLFAAGEVVGGIHGSNRLGGNATADVLTFGRIAGMNVLAE